MKKVLLIPNMITAFGLACGLFVIFKTSMLEVGSGDYLVILTSTYLLLVAAFADFVDGAIARAMRAESEFGILFDTLSDAISFGVAPSVLLLKALSLEQGTFLSFFAATGAMIYSICGVLRLVRFNIKKGEAKGNSELEAQEKKHFTGLPIPAAAAAATSLNLLLLFPYLAEKIPLSLTFRASFLSIAMIFLGYLMVCRLKFPSLKVLHIKVPSFQLAILTVVFSIFILYGILHFFPLILGSVAWSYIFLALILSLIRFVAGKKSKTLEDFEPDSEDHDL